MAAGSFHYCCEGNDPDKGAFKHNKAKLREVGLSHPIRHKSKKYFIDIESDVPAKCGNRWDMSDAALSGLTRLKYVSF